MHQDRVRKVIGGGNGMMKRRVGPLVVLALVVFGGLSRADAITLSLDPVTQDAGVGSLVNVAVVISGLTAAGPPSLGAFDISIGFAPGILGTPAAVFGDQLDVGGFGSVTIVDTSVPGAVSIAEVSLDTPAALNTLQADSFTLATLTFFAIGAGTTPLSLALNAPLADAEGAALSDILFVNGSVTVIGAAVPEPTTAILLVCAVAGLAAVSSLATRRMRRRRSGHET